MNIDQRFPLSWPPGWPRTPPHRRQGSPFKRITTDRAMNDLLHELALLGARRIIVSSNLKLRQDGLPYSQQPRTEDEGIAVYFQRKGEDTVLACDKYHRREENMRAITLTIGAIRGIERWGSSDLMERAFQGFTQLGHEGARKWWDVLGVASDAPLATIEAHYLRRRSATHPDNNGDAAEFAAVQAAWAQARKEHGNG